jgi:ribose transport system substrate-binding protein
MKPVLKVLYVPLVLLALAGCGGQGGTSAGNQAGNAVSATPGGTGAPAGANSGRQLRIAVIPKTRDALVFDYARIGAQRAAKRLGNVELIWEAPPAVDAARQAAIVDAQVASGVAGILLSAADPEGLKPSIDGAVAKGIPVVTFDSDSPTSKRVAYYGVDDLRLGQRLGLEIARQLNNRGRVAILSGVKGAYNLDKREEGVRAALKRFPKIQIVQTYYCNDDVARSAQIVSDVTRAQKPAGWVFVGGWPLLAKNGLNAITPGKTKIVSVDPLPPSWKWIEKNYVQVCLGQKVFGWGEVGVKLVVDAINKKPVRPVNDSGFDVVTPKTLNAYKKQWAQMSKQ